MRDKDADKESGSSVPIFAGGFKPEDPYAAINRSADSKSGGYGPGGPPVAATPQWNQNPGLQAGSPFAGAQGLDFLQPGAAEKFFSQNQGFFTTPGQSENFARTAMQQFGAGGPQLGNNAQDAYNRFNGSTPADMSSFYSNAGRQASEGINTSLAARGSYGSSAANGQISEALGNLAADRAKSEASYGLQRAGVSGQLAQGADQTSLGNAANQRGWLTSMGGLAQNADQSAISRMLGGMGAATGAQNAQTTRGQNMFNNQMQMGQALNNTMGNVYGSIFGNDMGLFGDRNTWQTGTAAERANQAGNNAQQNRADTQTFMNNLGNTAQTSMGIYQMLNKDKGTGNGTPIVNQDRYNPQV